MSQIVYVSYLYSIFFPESSYAVLTNPVFDMKCRACLSHLNVLDFTLYKNKIRKPLFSFINFCVWQTMTN